MCKSKRLIMNKTNPPLHSLELKDGIKKQCCNCSNLFEKHNAKMTGLSYCICFTCYNQYSRRWTEHTLKKHLDYGISANPSKYTVTYINNLPFLLKKLAKEKRKEFMKRVNPQEINL